jgi:hypothetical protein
VEVRVLSWAPQIIAIRIEEEETKKNKKKQAAETQRLFSCLLRAGDCLTALDKHEASDGQGQ